MTLLFAVVLVFQAGVRNDVVQLRQYLGLSYRSTIQALGSINQILLKNTEPLAPAQAAEMRANMRTPDKLPPDNPIVSARIQNVGQGMLTFLFEDDFLVEQVNFVFCREPERVIALQVLFDDSRAVGPTPTLLQTVYQMPRPIVPPPDYKTQLMYPLAANLPVTVWNMSMVEAIYQPVLGNPLVTGQLWLTDKAGVMGCSSIPRL